MKRVLLLYLSFSIFWLTGHKDAVHHLLHGLNSHQEISASKKSHGIEFKLESHHSCWIEDFLHHRSHQSYLTFDLVTLFGPVDSLQALFEPNRFVVKDSQHFSQLARGPPAFSLS